MTNEETITISLEEYNRLISEREMYKADVGITVSKISLLLRDLGILTPENEIEFSMKRLARNVMPIIMNPSGATDRFAYLGDLADVITRHADAIPPVPEKQ